MDGKQRLEAGLGWLLRADPMLCKRAEQLLCPLRQVLRPDNAAELHELQGFMDGLIGMVESAHVGSG